MTVQRDVTGEVEQFFDGVAAEYDRAYEDRGVGGTILRKRAAAVVDLLGAGPGELLDAGMGAGYLCAELDRRGWSVSGIDISAEMVAGAHARLPHLRERLRQGDIRALPFPDGSFDAVVATGVLEYAAADLATAVAELARVLRPGATAVVSFPNLRAPVNVWRGRLWYPIVRAGKRLIPVGCPMPPPLPRVPIRRLQEELARHELAVDAALPVGVRPAPGAVAARLERSGSSLAQALAVQVVFRARKRS